MDGNGYLVAPGELDSRNEMLIERVDATGSNQSYQMQRAVVPTCALAQLDQLRNAKELPRLDGL